MVPAENFLSGMLEVSKIMVRQASPEDTIQEITDLAVHSLGPLDGVGLTLVEGVGPDRSVAEGRVGKVAGRSSTPVKVRTAAYSSAWVVEVDVAQYKSGEGPCLHAISDGKLHEIPDVEKEDGYSDFSELAAKEGVGSALALPLKAGERVMGAMNMYSRTKEAFDAELVQLAEAFATHIAAVIGNIDSYRQAVELAENLKHAMESRATIEQAKGMIMFQRTCTPEEAFQTLVAASQARNQKLKDVAAEVVAGAVQGEL